MRMGASTNNTRGGFSGSRPPRTAGASFENNSPIRLNLPAAGGTGGYDQGAGPHYDPHQAPAHAHPSYHQSPQGSNNSPFTQSSYGDPNYPPYPANSGFAPPPANEQSNPGVGGPPRGIHQFPSDFSPGGPNYNAGPDVLNEPYRGHTGNPHRPGRGGFRGSTPSGGRSSRDRVPEMGVSDSMTPRPNRGYGGQPFGSSNKPERLGSGNRPARNANGPTGNRTDDFPSNCVAAGNGPGRHTDRSTGPANRGSRSISNLPTLAFHKGNQHLERRGGGVGLSRGLGDRASGNRLGRRNNPRDLKFDDRKNLHRMGGRGGAPGANSGLDRLERAKQNGGTAGVRVKNGWGAQFKEFNDREKDRDRVDEIAAKRTLTDFRIIALRVPDIYWVWLAENLDAIIQLGTSAIVANIEESQNKACSSPETKLITAPGKNTHNDESGCPETGKTAPNDASKPNPTEPNVSSLEIEPAEPAKRIQEEASSAVKDLNLTVDEHNSDREENDLEQEITDQLLPRSQNKSPTRRESQTPNPQPGNIPAAAVEELDTSATDQPVPTSLDDKSENVPPDSTRDDSESVTIITHAPPSSNPAPVTKTPPKDRVHPSTKPSLPAGRENSRLRLYFSSPATEVTTLATPASLPNKPVVGSGVGKRKLSVSGNSVVSETRVGGGTRGAPGMNVDTVGGGARGTSSMSLETSPARRGNSTLSVETMLVGGAQRASDVKPHLSPMPVSNDQPPTSGDAATKQPETSTPAANPPADIVEIANPETTNPSKEANSTAEDVKPVIDVSSPTTEASAKKPPGEESKLFEVVNEEPSAECVQEEKEDEEYESPPIPEPQADRLSISYARNTRRIVIDADVVESIKVFRAEHKIEVMVRLMPAIVQGGKFDGEVDIYRICKGVLVEALDQELDDYVVVDRATLEASWLTKDQRKGTKPGEGNENSPGCQLKDDQSAPTEEGDGDTVLDPLLPPLHRLFLSSLEGLPEEKPDAQEHHSALKVKAAPGFKQDSVLLVAELDTANPLTEAKWVRTGDVDSWISQMTGRIFKPEEKAECGWRRKITVVDPDPPPTIQHLLDTWLTTSVVGSIDSRQRFIDRHVAKNVDVIIEILLRVIRAGGNNTSHHANPLPLIVQQAASLHAPYPEQQTQVSLAVLGLYRLSIETALEAGSPVDKVIKKATDIVRSLPYRLAFSALDGIYKDEHQPQ